MRTIVPALLLLAACGDPGVLDPWTPPDGALDLNAASIQVAVRTQGNLTQQLRSQNREIDRLEVVARMKPTDISFAPSVNLPTDQSRPLVWVGFDPAVQDESSSQPTTTVILRGYAAGKLEVQVRAFSGGEVVGAGCESQGIDQSRSNLGAEVVLTTSTAPCLP